MVDGIHFGDLEFGITGAEIFHPAWGDIGDDGVCPFFHQSFHHTSPHFSYPLDSDLSSLKTVTSPQMTGGRMEALHHAEGGGDGGVPAPSVAFRQSDEGISFSGRMSKILGHR